MIKFGPLDASAREPLAEADAETLERWGERGLTATNVEDVFA
jgi:hypothetical protein